MKVLLIDDHALFREALSLLLQSRLPGIELLHASRIGEALDRLVQHPDIDLALLDLALPDSTGIASLQRWRARAANITTLVLSADDRPETALAVLEEGAAGLIPKSAQGSALESALLAALDGPALVPPHHRGQRPGLPPVAVPSASAGGALDLSPRQLEVLRLLIEGKSNKLICRALALSESTVKTHLAAIFRKLKVETRTQAVVAAVQLGVRISA